MEGSEWAILVLFRTENKMLDSQYDEEQVAQPSETPMSYFNAFNYLLLIDRDPVVQSCVPLFQSIHTRQKQEIPQVRMPCKAKRYISNHNSNLSVLSYCVFLSTTFLSVGLLNIHTTTNANQAVIVAPIPAIQG